MPQAEQNYCGYGMKLLCAAFAISAIICSWRASTTCEFISFVATDGRTQATKYPFDRAVSANVGIFRYEITDYSNGGSSGCVAYEQRWAKQQNYPSVATAEFCSIIAPLFAVLGAFAGLLDLCVCNFNGSFTVGSFLLLVAAGLQAGTFTMVADPVFCFKSKALKCEQLKGVYLSAVAVVFFFVASCLLCCAPRSDPFCFNFGREHKPATKVVKKEPAETIVLQPVIILTPEHNETSKKSRKPRSKHAKKKMSENV